MPRSLVQQPGLATPSAHDPVEARLLGRALRALAESASLLPRISPVPLRGDEIVVEVADPPDRLFPDR
ncbi:hypothetical protein [Streptomyces sp. NPDC005374]|uniref:hypothetical protein n=1 Tax=Streptomyces sp. NPDC005374 TaxID=3364713 RepID=UPI0036D140D9